jgi:hypothetical protein
VTEPDERLPYAGAAEPGSEHDPEVAEAYAESVGVDPTPEEIDHYLAMEGEPSLAEQADRDDARRES